MALSNQSLSSWVVNLSANTRVHSCFHSDISGLELEITSATAFSMPCRQQFTLPLVAKLGRIIAAIMLLMQLC